MKKKWLSYTCIAATLIGGLTSCNESSFLDVKDINKISDQTFWRDKADAESALAATYSPIKWQMYGFYGAYDGWLNINSRGDDIFTVPGQEMPMWTVANFENTPATSYNAYSSLYSGIQRANVLLHYIDKIPASGITEEDRSMIKGEALFLRAYQYYLLVTNYKEVPLRLIPSNDDTPTKAPATEAELWEQVEKDLIAAINSNLPISRPDAQKGRVEKGAAITMLGKAYLTQGKIEDAKTQLGFLMQAPYYPGKYGLMEDFSDNFIASTEFNKESVFELSYSSDGDGTWGNESGINLGSSLAQFLGPRDVAGGWCKLMPSAFIVAEFAKELRADAADTKFDKRMYGSFFFEPEVYGDKKKNELWYGGRYNMDAVCSALAGHVSGGMPNYIVEGQANGRFMLKKYTGYYADDPMADSMNSKIGRSNNVRLIRFAEVILMYAEACARTNDVTEANRALKLIRDRAGLDIVTYEQDELMPEIEHQCLLEFFGEGHRFDDLKRWYTTDQIKEIFTRNNKQGANNFQEKYKYYPIPVTELGTNTEMHQITLWQ